MNKRAQPQTASSHWQCSRLLSLRKSLISLSTSTAFQSKDLKAIANINIPAFTGCSACSSINIHQSLRCSMICSTKLQLIKSLKTTWQGMNYCLQFSQEEAKKYKKGFQKMLHASRFHEFFLQQSFPTAKTKLKRLVLSRCILLMTQTASAGNAGRPAQWTELWGYLRNQVAYLSM